MRSPATGASPGLRAHMLKLLQNVEDLLNRDERGEALGVLAQARKCMELASPDPEADAAAIDLALSESLIRRQNSLYQVCGILRCASRNGCDDANGEADTLYAVEAAAELLAPIADNLDLTVLRREARDSAS